VLDISSSVSRKLGYCISYMSHAYIDSRRSGIDMRYVHSSYIGIPVLYKSPDQAASNVAYVEKYAKSIYGGSPSLFAPCTLLRALAICAEEVECRTGRKKKAKKEFLPGKYMLSVEDADKSAGDYGWYIRNMYASSLCIDAGLAILDLESMAASNRAVTKGSFTSSIEFRGQDE